jgi:NADH-quinone oxidoreductase subunit C
VESAGPEFSSTKPPAPSPKPAAPGAKPAGPATPAAKPAAPAAKPAPKPVIKPEPWSSPQVDAIKERFGGAVIEALTFRNQNWITLALEQLLAVCQFLLSPEGGGFDYLADETAVDYPKREKRFEIVYIIYSFTRNERLRLKVAAGENDEVPSVVGLWPVANWLEREIYDMFGVRFSGHPDLKRILLPDGWTGHPLRKDYDILRQDTAWVKENLKIESGQ